jgi:hypothetical protein
MWIYDFISHCTTTLLFDRSSWSLQFYWATIVHSSSCTHDDANHIYGLARALHNRPMILSFHLYFKTGEAWHLSSSMLSTTDHFYGSQSHRMPSLFKRARLVYPCATLFRKMLSLFLKSRDWLRVSNTLRQQHTCCGICMTCKLIRLSSNWNSTTHAVSCLPFAERQKQS